MEIYKFMSLSIKQKTFKKVVSLFTTVATVVALSGVSMLSVTSVALADVVDGSLIKSNATNSDGSPTLSSLDVYIVKLVGTKKFKRLILNPTVFESYGHLNWADIQTVSQAVMDEYTTSALVRVDTDPDEKVYAMAPDGDIGSKSWVNLTAAEFLGVSGSEDGDSIYTINATDGGNYNTVGDITTTTELETFYSAGTLPAASEVTGGLAVSLSAETPESQTIVASSDGILMTKAIFAATDGDVVVTGMNLKRIGLGDYTDLARVWLVVDGARRGSSKSFNSSDEASLLFSADTNKVTIPDGTSKVFEIWAQTEDTGVSGNQDAVRITAVTTGSTVSGLPVTGNTMTMSSIAAPDVTFEQVSVGTEVNIGDIQVDVAKIKITNVEANEDAIVRGLTFKSIAGTSTRVGSGEVANLTLYDSAGNVVAGPVTVGADYYVRFVLDSPFTIEKGGSKSETFTVKADIIAGPDYDINLDVEYTYDLDIIGGTNGYSTDNGDSFTVTEVSIANAALSVNVDSVNNPLTRTMTDDTDNVLLLAGNFRADQGNVTISQYVVNLTGNDMDDAEFINLKFYVNGVLVSEDSTVDFDDNDTTQDFTFTDEISVSGVVPFEVKIDAETSIDANDWIRATVAGSNVVATRDSDGAAITESGTATGNKVTFGAASVTVTGSLSAPSVTRVKGSAGVIFAAFDVTVGTASDVTLKSIKLNYGADDGTTAQTPDQNDLQNIYLLKSDMSTWVGPQNLNSSEQYTFSGLNKAMTAGSTMRFYVKADIASTINDADITRQWLEIIEVLADDANNDAISVTDGSATISATNEENDDGANTIITVTSAGTLSVELSNSTPDTRMVVTGSSDITATEYKLRAQYEDVSVTKLVLTAVAGSGNDDEVAKVTLYADGAELASTSSVVSGVATFNFAAGTLVVPAGETVTLQVRTDINTSDDSLADTGATVQFGINDFNADINAQGTSSDIYAYVYKSDGTGVTLTAGASTTLNEGATLTATDTTVTVASSTNIDVGNLLLCESEYMLVTAVSSNNITVVRGVANSTAATHADTTAIAERDQKVLGNTLLTYANYPVMSSPTQPAGGQLNTGIYEVLKFTVDPIAGAEEDLRLADLRVKIDGTGMSATGGWHIINAWLYNGTKQVGATVTTDLDAAGDITFVDLETDVDGIVTASTVFTVKVEVALGSTPGTIDAGDFMRASIDSFGSASAAGAITNDGSDLYWVDMEGTGIIEWIDTSLTEIKGNEFNKTT